MSETDVQLVKKAYDAFGRGDIPSVIAMFDPAIQWREAEGNPYQPDGSAWIGAPAIVTNLFERLGAEWEPFIVTPQTFVATADGVLAQGRYTGKFKPTGRSIDVQFAHVWTMRDGKITAFQQYVDTGGLQAAMTTAERATAAR